MEIVNLLKNLPEQSKHEIIEILHEDESVRIERIISYGHSSPRDFWYDQNEDESVTVLSGSASLQFHEEIEPINLRAGDFVHIPAHKKHRVEWTDESEPTIWLAIFSKHSKTNSN